VTNAGKELFPPVAVFGDALRDRPAGRRAAVDMRMLSDALRTIEVFAPVSRRAAGISTAAAVAKAQAERLATQVDLPGSEPAPLSAAQLYFRVRTAALSADQALWHCLRVIAAGMTDLADAPLGGSDIHRLAAAMSATLRRMSGPQEAGERAPRLEEPVRRTDEETWLRRWILGHQLHAMLNVHAAYALADAAAALRREVSQEAVTSFDDAAEIVGGFAPARALALALPASFYQDVLRPSMLPPLTDAPLTGRMHVEYQAYRKRLDDVIGLMPQSSTRLAASDPMLALARERILEADLIEAERHVTSVEPLVGDSRSLIQSSKSADNAVSALRRIRHRRAARIASFVRYPDTMVGSIDRADQERQIR
jgi:hypothetical protein